MRPHARHWEGEEREGRREEGREKRVEGGMGGGMRERGKERGKVERREKTGRDKGEIGGRKEDAEFLSHTASHTIYVHVIQQATPPQPLQSTLPSSLPLPLATHISSTDQCLVGRGTGNSITFAPANIQRRK